jgi:hypothetical protein
MMLLMPKSELPPTSPKELLHIKDTIHQQWQKLPPEHQASTILVLLSQTLDGEYGPWLSGALEVMSQHTVRRPVPVLPIPPLTRGHLELANLSEDEIAQFSEADLRHIAHEMMDHYANDVFWEELEYLAQKTLEEKRGK